jgi:hypothetical protein
MAKLRRDWYQRNKEDVCSKQKQEYALNKINGQTYYQLNKTRILARKRELYTAKKVQSMDEPDGESD